MTDLQFLTPPTVGKILGVDPSRVIGWIRAGKLDAINLSEGRRPRYRVSRDALDRFLRQRQVVAATKPVRNRRKTYRWYPDDGDAK